jgi:glycosyltransferase involved in cell wall biosynthesis
MRILQVISSLAARDGGPAKAAIEMCRELLRRGEHAEIYTTNVDGKGCVDVSLGIPIDVRGVSVTYFPVNGSHYYKLSFAMAAALRANCLSFDIVHINSLYQFPSTIAAHYCRKFGVPYILRPHGTLDPFLFHRHRMRKSVYEALFDRRNLAAAAAVSFTAEEEMELARSLGLRFRGAIVPLGVDLDDLQLTTAKGRLDQLWPNTAGKKVALFLGRLNFKKGLDILARAFGTIARERQDVHLLLAGPDNEGYGDKVKQWLKDEGALDRVTFCGMITGREKAIALSQSTLFVLPSYTENFGIAVVEAMVAGMPVVISNKVNIWREVHRSGAGIVVNLESGELASAMISLLDDPGAAVRMGEIGRKLASESFSWNTVGLKLTDLYRRVLSLQRRPTVMGN